MKPLQRFFFCQFSAILFAAAAPSAPHPQRWTNSLGMTFVPVPGTNAKFSIWHARNQDFEAFATATHKEWEAGKWPEPDHPALVAWNDAKDFCEWLTKKEREAGTIRGVEQYRLPTDWEWSKAVGLDDDERLSPKERMARPCKEYPWGKQWPPPRGAANLAPPLGADDFNGTCPVGKFPPNHFGLYDMAGNAPQWCEDFLDGKAGDKVARGSGFPAHNSGEIVSSRRKARPADSRTSLIGFRCVLATVQGAVSDAQTTPTTPLPAAVPPPVAETPATPAETHLKELSQQSPNAMEWALAPLDQAVPSGIRQNIKLLREDLLDEAKAKPSAPPEAYALGRQLCDALVSVLDERDSTLVKAGYQAAQADANTEVTSQALEARRNHLMSWPQYAREKDQATEIFRQQMNRAALTKELPKVEWSKRTNTLRKGLDALYSKYRDALRQPNGQEPVLPAGNRPISRQEGSSFPK